jgi:hypothetical protein
MSDLLSFIGGGLVAVVATIGYQEVILWRDRWAQARAFPLKTLLVRDECHANLQTLKIVQTTNEPPVALPMAAYQSFQLDLASHLSPEARDAVRHAYVYAQTPRVLEMRNAQGRVVMSSPVVNDAVAAFEEAFKLLKEFVPPAAADV